MGVFLGVVGPALGDSLHANLATNGVLRVGCGVIRLRAGGGGPTLGGGESD